MYWSGRHIDEKDVIQGWRYMLSHNLLDYEAFFYASNLIVKHFLGKEWCDRHIFSHSYAFLSCNFRADVVTDRQRANITAIRVNRLGEMLFNFQRFQGFEEILTLLEGGQIQSTFSLMEIAMAIHCSGHKVSFRKATGVLTKDYDLDVVLSTGEPLCVEAKSRELSKNSTAKTIRERLKEARKQLPKNKAGAIVVRVPTEWATKDFIKDTFIQEASALFRNTDRVLIVSVITNNLIVSDNELEMTDVLISADLQNERVLNGRSIKLLSTSVFADEWIWLAHVLQPKTIPTTKQLMCMRNNIAALMAIDPGTG